MEDYVESGRKSLKKVGLVLERALKRTSGVAEPTVQRAAPVPGKRALRRTNPADEFIQGWGGRADMPPTISHLPSLCRQVWVMRDSLITFLPSELVRVVRNR